MLSNGNSYIKNPLKRDCLDASASQISFSTHCNLANKLMLILLQVKQETYNSIQLNRNMSDNLDAMLWLLGCISVLWSGFCSSLAQTLLSESVSSPESVLSARLRIHLET